MRDGNDGAEQRGRAVLTPSHRATERIAPSGVLRDAHRLATTAHRKTDGTEPKEHHSPSAGLRDCARRIDSANSNSESVDNRTVTGRSQLVIINACR